MQVTLIPEPGKMIDMGYMAVIRAPPMYIGCDTPLTFETTRLMPMALAI